MNTSNKTVIHVWTQKQRNYNNFSDCHSFYGLGDLVRGSIGLFRLCKRKNYKLLIDFSLHPISSCLILQKHEYTQIVNENEDNIYSVVNCDVATFIDSELQCKDVVLLNTSCDYSELDSPADSDVKNFIKNMFVFSDYCNAYMRNNLDLLPFPDFDIIHFRLGDDSLRHNQDNTKDKYIHIIESIKSSNSVLISDSIHLKEKASSRGVFTFNKAPVHVGSSKDRNDIMHTLFEFILLTKATRINSYTVYCWKSGFVRIADFIYNIPVRYTSNLN